MGALIRAHDWPATPLGDPQTWPRNLQTALRIMLASRQPIWIGWGPDLIYFYNDPYKSIIGGKHPWALGRPTAEIWREIWSDISPLLETAMSGDQGTYSEAQLLIMERNGYPEETYYTFSYSPVPNDDGTVGGIICANTDDTQRVIGERQMALLRDLAADATHARTWQEACARSAAALGADARDIPFALLYMADPEDGALHLAAASGTAAGHAAAPQRLALDGAAVWPVADALRDHELKLISGLGDWIGADLPTGPWPAPASQAAVVPILPAGETGRAGALVVGLNPFRLFDENYRSFLGLVAGQIAGAIANAQAYEEERRRAEALAEIDRAKTTFFSNVSHEFRTPLTLMLAPLEDALNDRGESALLPVHRNRLETAHRNSLRLLKLVNSLLDFARIEAGRVDAHYEPVDLAALTAELASNFESATERAGLALTIDCRTLPLPVHVDRDMWEKIVLNLISNAFKFTFDGEIAVALRPTPDGNAAELTVRDTGVGVPETELPRLFERFHRVEGQQSRSFEGSGIGLALVQELVKLHGGSIRAESEVGKGTVFAVTIPFGAVHLSRERIGAAQQRRAPSLRADAYVEEALRWLPASSDRSAEPAPSERADDVALLPFGAHAEPARILVADDNADMRAYIARLLGGRWEVETVADGAAALDAIRRARPDLVLTDVMMPRLDGFGLLRALRDDPLLRDLPVIVLSARAGEEARVEGLDSGADDYLTKPFAARELIARVNANLALARVRQTATRELRESEARFRNMAEHAPVMMWMTDPDGALTYLNQLWSEFTGQSPEEALGFGAWAAIHPEDRAASREIFCAANARQEPFRLEFRLRRYDGVYRWALGTAGPRFGGGAGEGAFLGYIGSVIDITERKDAEHILQRTNEVLEQRVSAAMAERAEAEAQLRQAQKMEAVGKLTGGVAHDFNNVLQVIGGNLQLLVRDVAGNLRAEQRLQTAIAAISRGSKLAAQLLAFGRRQPLAPKVVNLGRLLRGIDDMLRRALGEGVEVETVIAGGLWNTFVDKAQVENAILNLAINARDAMGGHGRLTIEAGNSALDEAYTARHDELQPGQYVMVAVSDTGSGMTPDVLERAFEPFFTTKPEGHGTGLGLSMVYGFVKQSGGHVKIYSEPGQGTTIRLYLPRSREEEDVEIEFDAGPATGGTETVLVVEDDEDVRGTVIDMLTDLGYRVLKAKDAQSALAIIESGIAVDLIFTDVVMPGPLRSPELARKARERLPNVAVLFTSGYTENAIVHGGRLDDGIELLSKPYTREALARKLRHVLRNQEQRRISEQRVAEAAARRREQQAKETEKPRHLRVLLVEDDALIRMSTAEMLLDLGHVVTEAENGEQALAQLERGRFDVMLTDVSLPGISGDVLAASAVARQPGLGIIFASGYDRVPNRDEALKDAMLLQKPYDETALAEALRTVTDRKTQRD
ncbi:response regulator [Dongia sedimenti]|uniref:histidine kinase n=1 Tax=Dongia sedimenti TaxID=3064282 RepID=A0ABU0YN48_9PROT|nr:response regulator [Rhodospirillaceae bacterium R-7]